GAATLQSGANQTHEERMRGVRPGPELRVRLSGDEERMVDQLHVLDEVVVGRQTGEPHAVRLEVLPVPVVHLEAMTMPLIDQFLAVESAHLGSFGELGGV